MLVVKGVQDCGLAQTEQVGYLGRGVTLFVEVSYCIVIHSCRGLGFVEGTMAGGEGVGGSVLPVGTGGAIGLEAVAGVADGAVGTGADAVVGEAVGELGGDIGQRDGSAGEGMSAVGQVLDLAVTDEGVADGGAVGSGGVLDQKAGANGWVVIVSVESPADFPEGLGADADNVVLLTGGAEEFEHFVVVGVVGIGFYEFHITWWVYGVFLKGS